jgi:hypothetical protein
MLYHGRMESPRALLNTTVLCLLGATGPSTADVRIRQVPGQAEVGTVEIHNVGAGPFDPAAWREGPPNLLPDARSPLVAPRVDGVFRNIYAPSAVEAAGGWRLFYGAWDGVPTGNDRIYSVDTPDFLTFDHRRLVVDHGEFIHVCNVSAVTEPDGGVRLMCTAYPVGPDLNKPVVFKLASGPADGPPRIASRADLVTMERYGPFAAADMNGMNALLRERDLYRLYFGDFRNPGHVHRATSRDGRTFRYDGPSLNAGLMVNDVRKLTRDGKACYLMGLHANRDRLWYALSADGLTFEPQRELAASLGSADRYIVAIGWVTRGDAVLGLVYGAGAVPELNRNRLFARWVQKRIVHTDNAGQARAATAALGPDRAIIPLGSQPAIDGRLQVFDETGRTPLGQSLPIRLVSGAVYRLETTDGTPPSAKQRTGSR